MIRIIFLLSALFQVTVCPGHCEGANAGRLNTAKKWSDQGSRCKVSVSSSSSEKETSSSNTNSIFGWTLPFRKIKDIRACIPECKPKCKTTKRSSPPRKKKHCFDRDKIVAVARGRNNKYYRRIQLVLTQGMNEVVKLANCFGDNLKTSLQGGLGQLLKDANSVVGAELCKLERRIVEATSLYNKNILRETEALVERTNDELLDSVSTSSKNINKAMNQDIVGIISTLSDAEKTLLIDAANPNNVNVPLARVIAIVTSRFAELVQEVMGNFKKSITAERHALKKVTSENKNQALASIAKAILEFSSQFVLQVTNLTEEETKIIGALVYQNSRKLLLELETIFYNIGDNIIGIVKGCHPGIKPSMSLNPVPNWWNHGTPAL